MVVRDLALGSRSTLRTADDFPQFVTVPAEKEHKLRKPGTSVDCE
jgi:hypothetical protein